MTFDGLPELGAGYVYEGWIIVDGAAVSTGRFTVDDAGALTPASFSVPAAQADAAAMFVLTLEPAVGDDPAPSDVHLLGGDVMGGAAALDVDHAAAIGTAFDSAAGGYMLATPTSAASDDDAQGLWYLRTEAGAPMASLTLPTLPAGWVYEGWVVGPDGPVSTGRFTDAAMADDDLAGATSGPDDGPPFPGQDFIDPAKVLTGGYAAVISVEPDPDDSPGPFVIKPLMDADIEAVAAPMPQPLANIAADTLPMGSAMFE